MFHVPELYRKVTGRMASRAGSGNNGAFCILPSPGRSRYLIVIASDGLGWEHISIHAEKGQEISTPYWDEMQEMKLLFWDEEDVVMQLHPRSNEYVNIHPHTLHLWRPIGKEIPAPPSISVG